MASKILNEKFDNFDKLVDSGTVDILNSNTTMSNCFDIKLDHEDLGGDTDLALFGPDPLCIFFFIVFLLFLDLFFEYAI
tara:strand:+ start:749 stop:985 length:237 start_codon:yes stop_codon:yes gene_type:complete